MSAGFHSSSQRASSARHRFVSKDSLARRSCARSVGCRRDASHSSGFGGGGRSRPPPTWGTSRR